MSGREIAVRVLVGLFLGSLSFPAPAAADEKPRGVVLRFLGPKSAGARRAVVRALGDELTLVPKAKVERRARQLGVQLQSERGRARVAEDMSLDVITLGRVRGRGKARRVQIRIYGRDGRRAAEREATSQATLGDTAVEAVREALGASVGAAPEDWGADDSEAPPRVTDEPRSADDEDEEATDMPDREGAHGRPLLILRAGGGVGSRDVRIRLASEQRRVYDSGPFPELTLGFELNPLREGGPLSRGLFFEAETAFAVGLDATTQGGDTVGTTAYRFRLAAGHRFEVGRFAFGPALAFGYEVFGFSDNDIIPDARYAVLEPGAVLRLDLLETGALALEVHGAYRAVLAAGAMESDLGESLSTKGYRFGVGLGGVASRRFAYRASVGFARTGLDYRGAGTAATADRGHDAALAAHFTLGAAF